MYSLSSHAASTYFIESSKNLSIKSAFLHTPVSAALLQVLIAL